MHLTFMYPSVQKASVCSTLPALTCVIARVSGSKSTCAATPRSAQLSLLYDQPWTSTRT